MLSEYKIGTEGEEVNPAQTFTEKKYLDYSVQCLGRHAWCDALKFVVVSCIL